MELIRLGSIYLNDNRIFDLGTNLRIGDHLRVHLEPRRFQKPHDLRSRITEETKDYLVVDKPAGLPVHAFVDNREENLISFLEQDLGIKLFVTHRLDVDTTGLVILAKSADSQAEFNEAFRSRTLKRKYLALIEKRVELGTYVHYMKQSPKAPKEVTVEETEGSLRCELRITSVEEAKVGGGFVATNLGRKWVAKDPMPTKAFEIEIELVTGRTHQIRAQLAALGAPLLGDSIYGSGFPLQDESTGAAAIALWAFKIQTTLDETILRPS
jgi:23S rRNA pseudouridine1911/1915/1917 synthase